MGGILICVAASVVGVDVGWQQTNDGQWEVIVQIEPELLEEMLRSGELREDLITGIPPHLRGVRRYRIRIGNEKPPQEGGELPPAELTSEREQAGPHPATSPTEPDGPVAGDSTAEGPYSPPSQPAYSPPRLSFPRLEAGPADGAGGSLGEPYPAPAPRSPSVYPPPPSEPEMGSQPEQPTAMPGGPEPSDEPSPSGPQKLTIDPTATQLDVEPAVHLASSPSPSDSKPSPVADETGDVAAENPPAEPPGRPWLPLALALLGLSGSLGANAWLLWIARDFRTRYRTLLAEREPVPESH